MNFKAKHISGAIYKIYSVDYNSDKTRFLIFHEGCNDWVWWESDSFKPVREEERDSRQGN